MQYAVAFDEGQADAQPQYKDQSDEATAAGAAVAEAAPFKLRNPVFRGDRGKFFAERRRFMYGFSSELMGRMLGGDKSLHDNDDLYGDRGRFTKEREAILRHVEYPRRDKTVVR